MLSEIYSKESAAVVSICLGDAAGVTHCHLLTLLRGVAKPLAASAAEHRSIGEQASYGSDKDSCLENEASGSWGKRRMTQLVALSVLDGNFLSSRNSSGFFPKILVTVSVIGCWCQVVGNVDIDDFF